MHRRREEKMNNAAKATEISIAANLKNLWLLETKEKNKQKWNDIKNIVCCPITNMEK